jgi:hypothetical protein
MEIMGLAFVVILISLGLLFYVTFQTKKPQSEIKQTFTASQKGANFLNTLLRTNTQCAGATVTQLLQDCSEHQGTNAIFCSVTTQYSCDYVNDTIAFLLTNTLESWQDDYYLKACVWNTITQECSAESDSLVELGTRCVGERESASQFIPTSSGIIKIWIDICT